MILLPLRVGNGCDDIGLESREMGVTRKGPDSRRRELNEPFLPPVAWSCIWSTSHFPRLSAAKYWRAVISHDVRLTQRISKRSRTASWAQSHRVGVGASCDNGRQGYWLLMKGEAGMVVLPSETLSLISSMPFPVGSDGKASACNAGDPGSIPGLGRSPGEGNGHPLQHSCLENSMDGEAGWSTVHGVAKSQTWPSNFTFTFFQTIWILNVPPRFL